MLKENLVILRNLAGYSQSQVAEKINISRQAYAKWESGSTVPDVEKCRILAELYGVTIDSLVRTETEEAVGMIPPAPAGKYIWGSVTVNDSGQVMIPRDVRKKFDISAGTRLVVLSDENGIVLFPAEEFENHLREIMKSAFSDRDSDQ